MRLGKEVMAKTLRIGGASGFWGDASHATAQLLAGKGLDFIVYDYLAEITMAVLARARAKDDEAGFAADFVSSAMAPNLVELAKQNVRVVSNAGGVNPVACAESLRAEIKKQGLDLSVAVVQGDDLLSQVGSIASKAPRDMFSGAAFPPLDKIASVNAYVGAFPIAMALDRGADIVVTGRCVDSAVTLGACIHHFGWTPSDLDELAGGSLAGHILECGPQATGGNFTDWQEVADGLADIGYPIADVSADGSFEVRKPEGTSGRVSRGTVAEQMLYEIGDPRSYVLPDVVCNFSDVLIEELGADRVRVSGAAGRGIPGDYKTCLTWANGFRSGHYFTFYGTDAAARAKAYTDAVLTRCRRTLKRMNAPDYTKADVEFLGTEAQFGVQGHGQPVREVIAKIAVRHPDARAVGLFLKEATGLGLSAPPGLSGFAGTRPRPSPVLSLFSFLTPKDQVQISVHGDGWCDTWVPAAPQHLVAAGSPQAPTVPKRAGEITEVPLVQLAWARSGDKGDIANIGVIARDEIFMPWIWAALTEEKVAETFAHFCAGRVERFYLPGSHSMNILLHEALGGGGTSSLRNDPQAKGYSQLVLSLPVRVEAALLEGQRDNRQGG